MPTWPSSLKTFIVDNYQETTADVVLRTKMDAGNVKTRRRFSGGYGRIRGDTVWTDIQLEIWKNFFRDDLEMGAIAFDMPHPRTNDQIFVRYAVTAIPIVPFNRGGTRWRVSHELDVMP